MQDSAWDWPIDIAPIDVATQELFGNAVDQVPIIEQVTGSYLQDEAQPTLSPSPEATPQKVTRNAFEELATLSREMQGFFDSQASKSIEDFRKCTCLTLPVMIYEH